MKDLSLSKYVNLQHPQYDPPPLKTVEQGGGRGKKPFPNQIGLLKSNNLTHQSMKYPYKCPILPSPSNTLSMSAVQLSAHHRQILCPHGANYEFLSHQEIMPSRIYPVTFCWGGRFIFSFKMDRGRQFLKLPVITGILSLCFLRPRNLLYLEVKTL